MTSRCEGGSSAVNTEKHYGGLPSGSFSSRVGAPKFMMGKSEFWSQRRGDPFAGRTATGPTANLHRDLNDNPDLQTTMTFLSQNFNVVNKTRCKSVQGISLAGLEIETSPSKSWLFFSFVSCGESPL